MEELVVYDTRDQVSLITLNRPDKLNALNAFMRKRLAECFDQADSDPSTRVVVLRAAGRSFCVGYDLDSNEPDKEAMRHHAVKWHRRLSEGLALEMRPWNMDKPVIASIQGHALGAGCQLAMFCDLSVAADDAVFGEPEVRFSTAGPGMIMPWIIGLKRARELLYFGDTIDASTALASGMVNRVVPREDLDERTLDYARRLSLIAPEALSRLKLAINRGAELGFSSAMQAGLDVLAPLYAVETEEGRMFKAIKSEQGLRAAIAWRTGQFRDDGD